VIGRKKIKLRLASVFWLLALAIPMTPINGTTLGYFLLAAASLVALFLITSLIWQLSSGIRYEVSGKTHSYSQYEKRIRYIFVVAVYVVFLVSVGFTFWLSGVAVGSPPKEFSYLDEWSNLGDRASVIVNTEPLMGYKNNSHILIICSWPDFSLMPHEDMRIIKSRFFKITGGKSRIDIPMSPEFQKFRKSSLQFFIMLVPTSIPYDDILKVSDVTQHGGFLLATKTTSGSLVITK
jgi:hypothetical protein